MKKMIIKKQVLLESIIRSVDPYRYFRSRLHAITNRVIFKKIATYNQYYMTPINTVTKCLKLDIKNTC